MHQASARMHDTVQARQVLPDPARGIESVRELFDFNSMGPTRPPGYLEKHASATEKGRRTQRTWCGKKTVRNVVAG